MGLKMVDGQQGDLARRRGPWPPPGPTNSEPARPGVLATATASMSSSDMSGLPERLVDDRQDAFQVGPGGDLRHHAAEALVQSSWEATTDAMHFQPVGDDRRRRFVAGGFQGEDHIRTAWFRCCGAAYFLPPRQLVRQILDGHLQLPIDKGIGKPPGCRCGGLRQGWPVPAACEAASSELGARLADCDGGPPGGLRGVAEGVVLRRLAAGPAVDFPPDAG